MACRSPTRRNGPCVWVAGLPIRASGAEKSRPIYTISQCQPRPHRRKVTIGSLDRRSQWGEIVLDNVPDTARGGRFSLNEESLGGTRGFGRSSSRRQRASSSKCSRPASSTADPLPEQVPILPTQSDQNEPPGNVLGGTPRGNVESAWRATTILHVRLTSPACGFRCDSDLAPVFRSTVLRLCGIGTRLSQHFFITPSIALERSSHEFFCAAFRHAAQLVRPRGRGG